MDQGLLQKDKCTAKVIVPKMVQCFTKLEDIHNSFFWMYHIISKAIFGPGQNLYIGQRNKVYVLFYHTHTHTWNITNVTNLHLVKENIPFQLYQKQQSLLKRQFPSYRTSPVYTSFML
jgi:hypothetical protein